ncbi:MAG: hypothetical protein Q8R20_00335, partial [Nanoarchaeota archaeon]|nr:hypothetical protein [Nanoarchaeota archaeon]
MNPLRAKSIIRGVMCLMAPIFFLAFFVLQGTAQTASGRETEAALRELGKTTGANVQTEEDARRLCNEERYLSACVEIGKKYNLYDEAEKAKVNDFLEEAKDEIAGEFRSCQSEECLLGVATKLAEKIMKKKPGLAAEFGLTPDKVKKKKEVVGVAKEVGVNVAECRAMDLDTAPVELLRGCARLVKDERVQTQIIEGGGTKGVSGDASIEFREALKSGRYACGDGTPEGCGNFCLNPGVEATSKGLAGIPEVCGRIAREFFGPEGVRGLEAAYEEVRGVQKYFEERRASKAFLTDDGKKLSDPKEIGRYLEGEAARGNTRAVERGMDFLIQYGFANARDKEFAITFVDSVKKNGRVVNFEECSKNPAACAGIVPEDIRKKFGKAEEARGILNEEMRREGVPDSSLCQNEEYGEGCARASMKALPRIEEMARLSPEVAYIAEDLRRHIEQTGGELQVRTRAKEEFTKTGKIEIAGKEFGDWSELDAFCETNGSLCLAEAAKKGFIEKDAAAAKYERTFDIQYRAPFAREGAFGGAGDFVFEEGDAALPYPAASISGGRARPVLSAEKKQELLKEFQKWLDNPVGPPPVPYGGGARLATPYAFQQKENVGTPGGTTYYISPEMERCLAERGVPGETIDILRKGGRTEDASAARQGEECARDIRSGKYAPKEPSVSLIPLEVETCLRGKGVREEDIRRMKE